MKARKLLLSMSAILGGALLYFFVGFKVQSRMVAALDRPRACPAAFSWVLERPRRIRQEVPQVLGRIGLYAGERVLEVGCGPGVYTVQAAPRLKPDGQLIAVDLQQEMVERASERVRAASYRLRMLAWIGPSWSVYSPRFPTHRGHSANYIECCGQGAFSRSQRGSLIRTIDSPLRLSVRFSRQASNG
jgi:SAM-dependent methyltransferase